MRDLRRQDGFTLLELLIAVTILVIVTSQLFMVFSSQKRTFSANQRVLDVQEDARLVLDLIAFDTRHGGYMVPRAVGVSSDDGGGADPDRLCVSDPSFFAEPVVGMPTVLDSRSEHFTGTRLDQLSGNPFPSDHSVVVESLDIDGSAAFDGSGTNDFAIGSGVIISDGVTSVCAKIENIDEGARTLVLQAFDNNGESDNYTAEFGTLDLNRAAVRVAPAIIYELDPGALTLTRNGMTLASSVEDLQVEYWVDNRTRNGAIDGTPTDADTEFPIHDLNVNPGWAMDTTRIRRVRVSVITRTDMREDNADGSEKITGMSGRPALANRTAAAAVDGFQRRRFVATVMPQNLM
jgi:prepilin-type N-terminal cleavage/methylation domain-containing protein